MKTRYSLLLLVTLWSPGALFGEDPRGFTDTLELKNYVEQALKQPPVKRTEDMMAPLKFPLIIDGERIKSLDADRDGIYLTPETIAAKATNFTVSRGKKYLVANIRPNTASLAEAKSIHALLVALCGNADIETCWSILGKSIDRGLMPVSSNTVFHLRYCYTTGESLNFLDVVFNTSNSNSTEDQHVWIPKVTLTMIHAGGVHYEMDSGS